MRSVRFQELPINLITIVAVAMLLIWPYVASAGGGDISEEEAQEYIETRSGPEFLADCHSNDVERQQWCDVAIVTAYRRIVDTEKRVDMVTICGPDEREVLNRKEEIFADVAKFPHSPPVIYSILIDTFRGLYLCPVEPLARPALVIPDSGEIPEEDAQTYVWTRSALDFLADCRSEDTVRQRWCDVALVTSYRELVDTEQRSGNIRTCGPDESDLLSHKQDILAQVAKHPAQRPEIIIVLIHNLRKLYPCEEGN